MKRMKFYLHHEEDPKFTMVAAVGDMEATVGDVTKVFVEHLNKLTGSPKKVEVPEVNIVTESKKVLPPGGKILCIILDRADTFVTISENQRETEEDVCKKFEELKVQKSATEESAESERKKTQLTTKEKKAPVKDESGKSTSETEPSDSPKTSREKSKSLMKSGDISIRNMMKQAEKLVSEGRARAAHGIYREVLQADARNYEALVALSNIYMTAERTDVAHKYIRRALSHYPTDTDLQLRSADCLLHQGKHEEVLKMCEEMGVELRETGATKEQKWQIQVLMARAHVLKGEQDMAIVILQGVLREYKEYYPALVEYGELTFDLGERQAKEAVTICISCLVENKFDKRVKKLLAQIAQRDSGLASIAQATLPAQGNVESLVYIANILKEYGALPQAIEMQERANTLAPDHINVFLAYIHMLEVAGRHDDAFQAVQKLLSDKPKEAVGPASCQLIQTCTSLIQEKIYLWGRDRSSPAIMLGKEGPPSQSTYTGTQLYLLAVWMTMVKILYVNGALPILPSILKLIDPVQQGKELHKTDIRNEAAYYNCISQLMRDGPPYLQIPLQTRFIYFVSDSHCITPAWRTIKYQGDNHCIHPVLTTGAKIWHLRPDSLFYTKFNFYNSIERIPDGATVIVNLGEIDCREALHICVEKCRYDNIWDAYNTVIEIYINLLRDLIAEHNWTVYIHPIAPVLDVTRETVLEFNRQLKHTLSAVSMELPLHWLNFLDLLLTPDRSKLLPQYYFDGTHLHPNYVQLLEKALNEQSH